MKKIILTEKQEQQLLEFLILEKTYPINPNKVLIVKKFLDKNFKKGTIIIIHKLTICNIFLYVLLY